MTFQIKLKTPHGETKLNTINIPKFNIHTLLKVAIKGIRKQD